MNCTGIILSVTMLKNINTFNWIKSYLKSSANISSFWSFSFVIFQGIISWKICELINSRLNYLAFESEFLLLLSEISWETNLLFHEFSLIKYNKRFLCLPPLCFSSLALWSLIPFREQQIQVFTVYWMGSWWVDITF